MLRLSALITVGVALALALTFLYGPWSQALIFSPAAKVCQLTGELDKQRQAPTRNHGRRFGVSGADYGYPVAWNGKLLFLFGDTRALDPDDLDAGRARAELAKAYDAVASGPLRADIEGSGCVDLEFATEAPDTFRPLRLRERPAPAAPPLRARTLGVFETPVSGFARGNELFAFLSVRDHPAGCTRVGGCALWDEEYPAGGQAKLARGDDNGTDFTEVAVVSVAKFQWPVAVVEARKNVPGLPEQVAGVHLTDQVVLIWGSGREDYYFRRGYPFLAVAPLSSVGAVGAWRYFAGTQRGGEPMFVEGEEGATAVIPFGNERPPASGQPPYHKCVGEFSVGRVPELNKWVMLYGCGSDRNAGYNRENARGIHVRTADAPWGPWSAPRLVFDPDHGYCFFMHHKWKCSPIQPNPGDLERVERDKEFNAKKTPTGAWDLMHGGEYAPFLVPSYTAVKGDETSLYFVMSTWNPYQVVLMRTRVKPLRAYVYSQVGSTLRRGWDLIRRTG